MRSLAGVVLAAALFTGCTFSLSLGGTDAPPPIDSPPPIDGLVDTPGIDTPPIDARLCYGTGLAVVCMTTPPTGTVVLPNGTLDTSVDSMCTEVVSVGGVSLCVIAGAVLQLPGAATFRAVGSRPVVLLGTDSVTIDGTVTVSSARGQIAGAGASTASCGPVNTGENDGGGAGGGAGGSFAGRGGNGGDGDENNNGLPIGGGDGASSLVNAIPTTIRAGCRGSDGGDGGGNVGGGGNGGGAVYIISGTQIVIGGRVLAAGSAGGGGGNPQSGGGGGGSGGLIGLDAPSVQLNGVIAANGGGGGEGAGINGNGGASGTSGTESTTPASGGFGGDGEGGDGGNGSAGSTNATNGQNENGGGGGGGGGAGYVYVKGIFIDNGVDTPPASN